MGRLVMVALVASLGFGGCSTFEIRVLPAAEVEIEQVDSFPPDPAKTVVEITRR